MLKFTKYVVDNSKVKQVLFSKTKFFFSHLSLTFMKITSFFISKNSKELISYYRRQYLNYIYKNFSTV